MSLLQFCPTCGNLLIVEEVYGTGMRFMCQTCPYIYNIDTTVEENVPIDKKVVDDVLGGEDAWKNVDQTDTRCPTCNHLRAYYMQVQIRSADEPMTTFYKCANADCERIWSEN